MKASDTKLIIGLLLFIVANTAHSFGVLFSIFGAMWLCAGAFLSLKGK